MKLGYMELYVNGYKYQRVNFSPGKFALDNPLGTGLFLGALSTPYNLTLANRLLQRGKYFLRDVKIKGFKMYDRPIDYFEIKSHINYHGVNKDSVWALPIGQRVYTDTIDRVFKFNLPEKNTNLFDIEVKNLGIDDLEFLEEIRDEFEKEVPKIVPFYDRLREIIFTAPISPDATPEIIRVPPRQKYLAPKNSCIIQEIEGQRYIKFVEKDTFVIGVGVTVICRGPRGTARPFPVPVVTEVATDRVIGIERKLPVKKKKGRKGICNPGVCIPLPVDPPPTEPPPTVYDPPVGCVCCLNPPPDEEEKPEVDITKGPQYHINFLFNFNSFTEPGNYTVAGQGLSVDYNGAAGPDFYHTTGGSQTGSETAGTLVIGNAVFDEGAFFDLGGGSYSINQAISIPKPGTKEYYDHTETAFAYCYENRTYNISWGAIANSLNGDQDDGGDNIQAGTQLDPFTLTQAFS
jgi:hypothetical protein